MKFKKFLSMTLVVIMALAMTVPASAAKPKKDAAPAVSAEKTVQLKGEQSGTEFDYSKECWSTWKNVIFFGGAGADSTDEEVSAWHLVYTDKKGVYNDLKSMSLTFENGETYDWTWEDGLSTNGSGNNPGWMVVAPADWGKLVLADSCIVTTSEKNVQFNISGYYEAGSKPVVPVDPDDGKVSATFTVFKMVEGDANCAGFTFAICDSEGNEVGTMTSTADGSASVDLELEPGVYTIREINQDTDKYEANTQVLTATVDENGNVTFGADGDNIFTNYKLGALEYETPDVTEVYTEYWHKLAYEQYTSVETLVSATGCEPGGKNITCSEDHGVLPGCVVEHGSANNGFTWLAFDKEALAAESEGVNIGISDKNKPIPDVAPENPWEKPVSPYYNVRIAGSDLIVTSNLMNFTARAYNTAGEIEFNPKTHSGASKQLTLSLKDIGDTIYLFLHVANKDGYQYSDASTATDTGELISRPCERPCGDVTVTVKNAAGEIVTDLTKLPHGDYTVTVTANGKVLDTRTVTVNPGETKTVTFPTDLTVQGEDEYHCEHPECPGFGTASVEP